MYKQLYLHLKVIAFFILFTSCKKTAISSVSDTPGIIPITDTTTKSNNNNALNSSMLDSITNSETLAGDILIKQNNESKYTTRFWQGIPSIGCDKNDMLYAAWYTGGKDEGPGNYVTVSVSKDKGITWSANELIIAPFTDNSVRYFDPAIWRGPDDNLYLFWTKCTKNKWDGHGGVWAMQLGLRNDTIMHSTAKRISDGVMINKPIYVQESRVVYLPITVWAATPSSLDNSGVFVYSSFYNPTRKKIGKISKLSKIPIPDSLRTFDEHEIVQTSDNNFLCYIRGKNGIYISSSSDNCVSWSVPVKLTSYGQLTSSRFHISKLQSGNLLLVINDNPYRTHLVVLLSKDNGKTWPYKLLIDNRANISYPDIDQTSDGKICMVYDFERYKAKEIDFVSFNEADLINNNPANIQRVMISH